MGTPALPITIEPSASREHPDFISVFAQLNSHHV